MRYVAIALLSFVAMAPLPLIAQASPQRASVRPPLELRGHRLGDKRWTPYNCYKKPADRRMCVDRSLKIGDVKASAVYDFIHDSLVAAQLSFDSDDYQTIVDAFTAKYGPADSLWLTSMQNRMGATFENEHVVWVEGETSLLLERYSTSSVEGRAALLSSSSSKALEAARDSAAGGRVLRTEGMVLQGAIRMW